MYDGRLKSWLTAERPFAVTMILSTFVGCASPTFPTSASRRLKRGPDGDFCGLLTFESKRLRCGANAIADDADDYASLWSAFDFPSPRPTVDWRRYVVVAFVEPSGCRGQFTTQPLATLRVFSDGALVPEYEQLLTPCFMIAQYTPCTGTAYAAAVRRDRVPASAHIVLDTRPRVPTETLVPVALPDEAPHQNCLERNASADCLSGGGAEEASPEIGVAPTQYDRRNRSAGTPRFDGAAGAGIQVGRDSSGNALTQAAFDLRLNGWFDPDGLSRDHVKPFLSSRTLFFGSSVGASLHARALRTVGSLAHGDPTLLFGFEPVFERREAHSHWVFPTFLGVALPEGGLGVEGAARFAYLGWSLPVSYRGMHPAWRQLPSRLSDWIGIEVAPTLLWYLGAPNDTWSAGASVSGIVW